VFIAPDFAASPIPKENPTTIYTPHSSQGLGGGLKQI
jgi:hypothetical protein